MRRDEFIAIHGEEKWNQLVAPYQAFAPEPILRNNANIIIHDRLMRELAQKAAANRGPLTDEGMAGLLDWIMGATEDD